MAPRPRDLVEYRVASLCADVLNVATVPIDANFFQIGGTSFLAASLLSRVTSTLGVRIGLGQFLRAPTVAGVAAAVRRDEAHEPEPLLVDVASGSTDTKVFFAH